MQTPEGGMTIAADPMTGLCELFGGERYAPPIVLQAIEMLGPSFARAGKATPAEVLAAVAGAFESYDDPWELLGASMLAVRMLNAGGDSAERRLALNHLVEQVWRQIEFKLT